MSADSVAKKQRKHRDVLVRLGLLEQRQQRDSELARETAPPVAQSRLLVSFLEPGTTLETDDRLRIADIDRLDAWLALRGRIPHFSLKNAGVYSDARYQMLGAAQFRALTKQVESVLSNVARHSAWIDSRSPRIGVLDRPIFVQKVVVANPDNSRVYLVGDLHSSFDSLLNILARMKRNGAFADNFTLSHDRYLIFLGDVVDRGPYSIELLALVFKLLIANPARVFFINGNHEDCETYNRYGLADEVRSQFASQRNQQRQQRKQKQQKQQKQQQQKQLSSPSFSNAKNVLQFTSVLHYLPSAIVLQLGNDVYQLCHGALTEHASEQSKIKALIDDTAGKQFAFLRTWLDNQVCYPDAATQPDNLKWGDFDGAIKGVASSERDNHAGGMKVFGWAATQDYLGQLGLTAIISGHQDFSNFTMLLSPNSATVGPLNVLVEPDENYTSLYRPKNYATIDVDAQFVVFKPGRDFLACNTSSSLASKGNKQGLLYDCFLTLFCSSSRVRNGSKQ